MKWLALSVSAALMACAATPKSSPDAGPNSGTGGSVGSGGSTSSGGNSGSGGTSASGGSGSGGSGSGGKALGADCINSPDDLIADFTTDNGVYNIDGREGGFYTYGDDSEKTDPPQGVLNPPEGGAGTIDSSTGNDECSGPGSFHVTATGFAIWGAALGTNLAPMDGSNKGWYDASKYKGISFWAKATKPLTGVQVSFPDVYTDGGANPVDADPNSTMCSYGSSLYNCSPFLVKFGDSAFPNYVDFQIDTTWKRFDIMFADTQQDSNNKPGRLLTAPDHIDLAHLTAMAIQVNALHDDVTMTVIANDFDISVDDVNFVR